MSNGFSNCLRQNKCQIVPAILSTTEEVYKNKLSQIKESNLFDWVQIDLMDNKFVQNRSIGPEIIAKYPTNLKYEAHLMVQYPENWIDELIKIPVARIIFPVEDAAGVEGRIQHISNHGIQVGLSINPETSVDKLEPYLDLVDVVLIMSVHPGFQGQEFIVETLEKVKEVFRLRSGQIRFKIEFDGGISEENIKQVANAGADIAIVGSGLFKYDNLEEGLKNLQNAL